ncbi:MAG: alpha/beta hydrolase [Phenylobacterium sp.]|uniref:alpha/beta hydrolase n=1 Tax=Phenylobacterium sp. TaxID=1871053 RepID=UPI002734F5BB|nr:alpha/beta hydrolase [Phenylobacterium sp.]MDP3748268.1 alpha/beta hydrolase [Phenylobacterium sp.]
MSVDSFPPETLALGRALSSWFEELEHSLGEDGPQQPWAREAVAPVFGQLDLERLSVVDARSLAAAVYDAKGRQIAATRAFTEGGCDLLVDRDRLPDFAAGAEPAWLPVAANADSAATAVVAYAPGARAATWRLTPELHRAAQEQVGSVVVLTTALDERAPPLRDACIAYGLTGLQTRVALETIRTGGIKAAADSLGLSYQTAREALADAMRRVGVQRLPGLVTRLTTLAFGVFPGHASTADVLADVWGLSERQIVITGMLAEGASRTQVAQLLGVSLSLVKKELDAAYCLLQVGSSAALARKLVEARALSWITAATAGGVGFVEDQSEPLRFALREDGGRIAFSDYGPASGKPVLILHSSMTTRIVSRKLLRALHSAGYRPIAVDRPGFGLTEPLNGADARSDPFTAATADVARVLAHLKIRRVDIVSRGAAQFLVALVTAAPDAIGQVVLVNPGPPYRYSGRSIGPLGAIKDAFVRNPATIRVLASFLAGQLTFRRLSRMMVQWTRGSPPDQKAVQDPEIVADFFRSVRMFTTGRYEGFLCEQAAISRRGRPSPFAGAAGWRILVGASDVLYEPEVVLTYWRELLPGARFQLVPDAGRFLAMTHPQLVAAALDYE